MDLHLACPNRIFDLVKLLVVSDGKIIPQNSPNLHAKDILQIQPFGKTSVQISLPPRPNGKFPVIDRPILL